MVELDDSFLNAQHPSNNACSWAPYKTTRLCSPACSKDPGIGLQPLKSIARAFFMRYLLGLGHDDNSPVLEVVRWRRKLTRRSSRDARRQAPHGADVESWHPRSDSQSTR